MPKLTRYESDEEQLVITNKELRGLIIGLGLGILYTLIIIYMIIPGLPLSGNLLSRTENLYIDKLFGTNSFFSNGFVFIITILFVIWGLIYGIITKNIKNNRDFVDSLGYSLNGIGKTLVYVFAGSALISIFKYSNIGNVIVSGFTNLIVNSNFSGLALVILLFISTMVCTLFVPSTITKWSIMSTSVVPTFLNAGMTAEFTQLVFRIGECATLCITPFFAYFIIYLAYLEREMQDKNKFGIKDALSYMLPYCLVTSLVLLGLIIIWYLIGIPLGINGYVFL